MNDCIFCKIGKKEIPSKIIYEDEIVFATMDIDPVCDGHVLIIPKNHIDTIMEVDEKTLTHMFEVAKELTKKLNKIFKKECMSYTFNYGEAQSVKHLHLHLMPDYLAKPTDTVEAVYEKIVNYHE